MWIILGILVLDEHSCVVGAGSLAFDSGQTEISNKMTIMFFCV